VLGLAASVLWTHYGRQCRFLSNDLPGAQVSAHTMWRAGAILLPLSLVEIVRHGGLELNWKLTLIQLYCIIPGGVVAFALWNNALRHWPASQVLLFNNLIPLSSGLWAHICLDEPITPTFWVAMGLVIAGVLIGQTNWQRVLAARQVPPE
jgi:drug/metabolite transporter (DMT)-like permease